MPRKPRKKDRSLHSFPKFEWSHYLQLACELGGAEYQNAENRLREARLRSSISRAYYSIFCRAHTYLRCFLGYRKTRENVHQNVIMELKFHDNRQCKQLGLHLERLRKYRNQADYDDQILNLPKTQKMAISLAKLADEILAQLPPTP